MGAEPSLPAPGLPALPSSPIDPSLLVVLEEGMCAASLPSPSMPVLGRMLGFAFSNRRCRTPVAARLSAAITYLYKFLFLPVVMGEVLRGKLVSVGFGVWRWRREPGRVSWKSYSNLKFVTRHEVGAKQVLAG